MSSYHFSAPVGPYVFPEGWCVRRAGAHTRDSCPKVPRAHANSPRLLPTTHWTKALGVGTMFQVCLILIFCSSGRKRAKRGFCRSPMPSCFKGEYHSADSLWTRGLFLSLLLRQPSPFVDSIVCLSLSGRNLEFVPHFWNVIYIIY